MKRSEIAAQNAYLLRRQENYRLAADVIARGLMGVRDVEAIAVIGSVASALWKEVPRFREYRRAGIEVWHECGDLDLAFWLTSFDNLGRIRKKVATSLRNAYEKGEGPSVSDIEVDIFLFEPVTDRYVGRLCRYNACPKGKTDCMVPGCGDIPFNRVFRDFKPHADILRPAAYSMFYRRGEGLIGSATELPSPVE